MYVEKMQMYIDPIWNFWLFWQISCLGEGKIYHEKVKLQPVVSLSTEDFGQSLENNQVGMNLIEGDIVMDMENEKNGINTTPMDENDNNYITPQGPNDIQNEEISNDDIIHDSSDSNNMD